MAHAELKIILIGPMGAGKSTIAELLSERLGLPRLEMDELRWSYYPEVGYDEDMARAIYNTEGTLGVLRYSKPFEAEAVEKVVAKPGSFVLDLGAGHSVYEDETLFARVEAALQPIRDVFLLLPSTNLDRSIEILNERFSSLLQREIGHVEDNLLELNEHYVKHPSNSRLAKHVVYTNGMSPEKICDQIIALISGTGKG